MTRPIWGLQVQRQDMQFGRFWLEDRWLPLVFPRQATVGCQMREPRPWSFTTCGGCLEYQMIPPSTRTAPSETGPGGRALTRAPTEDQYPIAISARSIA